MALSIALLTISDTRSLADDSSGDQLQRSLKPPTIAFTSDNSARMIAIKSAVN